MQYIRRLPNLCQSRSRILNSNLKILELQATRMWLEAVIYTLVCIDPFPISNKLFSLV